MRLTLFIGAIALGAAGFSYSQNGFAWMKSGSNLGPFETRIGGVTSELRKDNPDLETNIRRFVACGPDCTTHEEIFAERERILHETWPAVFDRLMVDGDWGTYADTVGDQRRFKEALALFGHDQLRNQCTPVIHYLWWNGGRTPEVKSNGEYQCTTSPTSRP